VKEEYHAYNQRLCYMGSKYYKGEDELSPDKIEEWSNELIENEKYVEVFCESA